MIKYPFNSMKNPGDYIESNNEIGGGFYPVGASNVWHSGIHIAGGEKDYIYPISKGNIYGYRMSKMYQFREIIFGSTYKILQKICDLRGKTNPYKEDDGIYKYEKIEKEQDLLDIQKVILENWSVNAAGTTEKIPLFSNSFVLIKSEISKLNDNDTKLVYYSLYMNLLPLYFDKNSLYSPSQSKIITELEVKYPFAQTYKPFYRKYYYKKLSDQKIYGIPIYDENNTKKGIIPFYSRIEDCYNDKSEQDMKHGKVKVISSYLNNYKKDIATGYIQEDFFKNKDNYLLKRDYLTMQIRKDAKIYYYDNMDKGILKGTVKEDYSIDKSYYTIIEKDKQKLVKLTRVNQNVVTKAEKKLKKGFIYFDGELKEKLKRIKEAPYDYTKNDVVTVYKDKKAIEDLLYKKYFYVWQFRFFNPAEKENDNSIVFKVENNKENEYFKIKKCRDSVTLYKTTFSYKEAFAGKFKELYLRKDMSNLQGVNQYDIDKLGLSNIVNIYDKFGGVNVYNAVISDGSKSSAYTPRPLKTTFSNEELKSLYNRSFMFNNNGKYENIRILDSRTDIDEALGNTEKIDVNISDLYIPDWLSYNGYFLHNNLYEVNIIEDYYNIYSRKGKGGLSGYIKYEDMKVTKGKEYYIINVKGPVVDEEKGLYLWDGTPDKMTFKTGIINKIDFEKCEVKTVEEINKNYISNDGKAGFFEPKAGSNSFASLLIKDELEMDKTKDFSKEKTPKEINPVDSAVGLPQFYANGGLKPFFHFEVFTEEDTEKDDKFFGFKKGDDYDKKPHGYLTNEKIVDYEFKSLGRAIDLNRMTKEVVSLELDGKAVIEIKEIGKEFVKVETCYLPPKRVLVKLDKIKDIGKWLDGWKYYKITKDSEDVEIYKEDLSVKENRIQKMDEKGAVLTGESLFIEKYYKDKTDGEYQGFVKMDIHTKVQSNNPYYVRIDILKQKELKVDTKIIIENKIDEIYKDNPEEIVEKELSDADKANFKGIEKDKYKFINSGALKELEYKDKTWIRIPLENNADGGWIKKDELEKIAVDVMDWKKFFKTFNDDDGLCDTKFFEENLKEVDTDNSKFIEVEEFKSAYNDPEKSRKLKSMIMKHPSEWCPDLWKDDKVLKLFSRCNIDDPVNKERLQKGYETMGFWQDMGKTKSDKFYFFHPVGFIEHMLHIYFGSCVFSTGIYPMNNPAITTQFLQILDEHPHNGIDLAIGAAGKTEEELAVFVKDDGELEYKDGGDEGKSYGFHATLTKVVGELTHKKIFGHMRRLPGLVALIGKKIEVKSGDWIGVQGNTGYCLTSDGRGGLRVLTHQERIDSIRAAHLHYEYQIKKGRDVIEINPITPFPN
jgi:hypothetical protein